MVAEKGPTKRLANRETNMKFLVALAPIATLSLTPAFADDGSIHAGAGYTFLDSDFADLHAANIRLGYDFNRYLGAEGEALIGIGDDDFVVAGAPAEVELDFGLGAFGKFQMPVGEQVRLFGRLGYIYQEGEASVAGLAISDGDSGFAYGGGAEISVFGRHGVRLDYTRYVYGDDEAANGYSAAFVLRF